MWGDDGEHNEVHWVFKWVVYVVNISQWRFALIHMRDCGVCLDMNPSYEFFC